MPSIKISFFVSRKLDIIILNNNNEIVAIGEIKNYLDGISTAYEQLTRLNNYIKTINISKYTV